MQKLVWRNSKGDEIDLTSGNFGIVDWEGFSGTELNIQSQQVPFQDGSVFLDGLLSDRDLAVTLAIYDNNDLETRYRLKRELIKILNPKLGEGYLIYTNDFINKKIKCISHIPLFPNKNSNEPGTQKASLNWTACNPYWEDLEETIVDVKNTALANVENDGDIDCGMEITINAGYSLNPQITNISDNKKIKLNGEFQGNIYINTNAGNKQVLLKELDLSLYGLDQVWRKGCYSNDKNLIVIISYSSIITSAIGEKWQTEQPANSDSYLIDIAYSQKRKKFYILNRTGKLQSSENGHNWVVERQFTGNSFNTLYVDDDNNIICVTTSDKILLGTDFDNLTEIEIPDYIQDITDVAYNKNTDSLIVTSSYGILIRDDEGNWTDPRAGSNSKAVCISEHNIVVISEDGIWNSVTGSEWNFTESENELTDVIYSKFLNLFIITGYNILITADDNLIWNEQSFSTSMSSVSAENIGLLLMLGTGIKTSENLEDWETTLLYSISQIVGESKKFNCIFTRQGKGHLKNIDNSFPNGINAILYSEKRELFCGVKSNNDIVMSSNGDDFTTYQGEPTAEQYDGIIEGKNNFVIYGYLPFMTGEPPIGIISSSQDGQNWVVKKNSGFETITQIIYVETKDLYVLLEDKENVGSIIYTSTDLINWTQRQIMNNVQLNKIKYIQELNIFITVGSHKAFVSSNATMWSECNFNNDVSNVLFWDICFYNRMIYICGSGGKIYISSNGGSFYNVDTNISSQGSWIFASEVEKKVIMGGYILEFTKEKNIIDKLSLDSDIDFKLKIGNNRITMVDNIGSLDGEIKYNQKYIGV